MYIPVYVLMILAVSVVAVPLTKNDLEKKYKDLKNRGEQR